MQASLWYRFTVPNNVYKVYAKLYAEDGDITKDTQIAIYKTTSCGVTSFDLVAANDNDNVSVGEYGLLSFIRPFGVIPNTTYYVQVDGRNGTKFTQVTLEVGIPPPNDTPCTATLMDISKTNMTAQATFRTVGATGMSHHHTHPHSITQL